jgi:polyisoprenoid-binding protein YceI
MTTFKNTETFAAWLEKTLKMPHGCYDLDAALEEVERQHSETGTTVYELRSHETTTGHTETYDFEASYSEEENENGGYDLTITF